MRARRRTANVLGSAILAAAAVVMVPARSTAVSEHRAPTVPILGNSPSSRGVEAVDQDGTNRRLVIERADGADQTGDGRRIAFVRDGVLHVANGDGTMQRPVLDGAGRPIVGTGPRWSPDQSTIAFTAFDADGANPRVARVPAEGGAPAEIAAGSGPDWSPDGRRLVFSDPDDALVVIEARPGGARATIAPPGTGRGPRWSPDGTIIGYSGPTPMFSQPTCVIGVVHPDGSGRRCIVTDVRGRTTFAGWGPNSRDHVRWRIDRQYSGSAHWTDPATGREHLADPHLFATDWAGATGPTECPGAYWLLGADGGVFSFGAARFHGSTGGLRLDQPVVGMAQTASGGGYWIVARDGGIFSFGAAPFHGSTGGRRLDAPVVGMASTPSGDGYWLVARDGGVFSFGDAAFHGSAGDIDLRAPIVGMARTPTGRGYWLVAADGGVFTYGDAAFHGSTGDLQLAQPVVGLSVSPSGNGYTLAARDGGTFAFGDATFPGSAADPGLGSAVVAAAGVGRGLLLASEAGEVAALDDARFCGSAKDLSLAAPIVAAAAA